MSITKNKIIRIVLMIVGLSAIFFGLFVGNHYYQKRSWVTVLALECLWEKQGEKQEYNEWYLIKKRPMDELPQGFFRGTHLLSKLTNEEIYQQYDRLWVPAPPNKPTLLPYDENTYTFADYQVSEPFGEPTKYHTLHRKNLNMAFTEDNQHTYASCKEITENEFYRNIRIQIKKKNSDYKL